jgi:hypothetical protein
MTQSNEPAQPPPYPAEKARGGEIICAVFIGGLAGDVVLGLLLAFVR